MRYFIVLLLLFLVTLQYRLWVGSGSWADIVSIEKKLLAQKTVSRALIERNAVLEQEVYSLKNGYIAIEELARTELGMIKEGETFYLFVNDNAKSNATKKTP